MRMYKCDRCGTMVDPAKRFCGHLDSHIVDLCETCHSEFVKDKELAANHYQRNIDAIKVKYGMTSIKEILTKEN